MTLNSNHSEFKHEYKGEDFAFRYEKLPLSLYLQADSHNKIFKAKFETQNTELKKALDSLCQFSIDKNLDDLLVNMACEFKSNEVMLDYSLLHFKEALYAYSGEKKDIVLIDSGNLVCRCAKLDLNAIQANFIREKGDKNEVLKKTNASMLCGQCKEQVNTLFGQFSLKHQVFLGRSYSDWTKSINESLEQFAFYSPEEFQGAEFKISKLELPKLELTIQVPHQSLKVQFAEKSLMNYLSKELEVGLEVNVILGSLLSN